MVDRPTEAFDSTQQQGLLEWRQGDCFPLRDFVYLADPSHPVTSGAQQLSSEMADVAEASTALVTAHTDQDVGLMAVITQSCDIQPRRNRIRLYAAVAPVVQLDERDSGQAEKGYYTGFAPVPSAGERFFADLSRIMTIDTGVLVGRERLPGLTSDDERRAFADTVGRRFSRFPFPDDVTITLDAFQRRVKDKHGRLASDEGRLLTQELKQIRVQADPSFDAQEFSLTVIFILASGVLLPVDESSDVIVEAIGVETSTPAELALAIAETTDRTRLPALWDRLTEAWMAECDLHGAVVDVTAEVVPADEFGADRMWRTHRLDLDHLSGLDERARSE